MRLGDRIAHYRKARGLSQADLARAINAGQTAVSSWERNRTEPKRADVRKIAASLGYPLALLEGFDLHAPGIQVPLISWVLAGQLEDMGDIDPAHGIERIAVSGLPPGQYFATQVRGDSMDRISPEGSRIIVDIADKVPMSGRAYLFCLRGETSYKIFESDPVPRLEPRSTNPAHRTIFMQPEQDWHVIGRVISSSIDL